ncbi:UNVERIFIED_CONTAM: hypothetical protein BEN50_20550 [Euhalothece sp. KZN 001]
MNRINLEQAQEIIGDSQAILRGYLTEQVLDFAYEIVAEKESKIPFDSNNGCGNPHQYWFENFESYRKMCEAFPEGGKNTRKYAKCCELVDKITLINQGMSLEEAKNQ